MRAHALQFNNIVETIYSLPLEDRLEIANLLEHNIAETRRNEIANNYKKAQEDYKLGKLKSSCKINTLKKCCNGSFI
jgi:predicted patatin/cPLA2 family phospholipase